jgi:deoxyribodipyrimidine photo-lyase
MASSRPLIRIALFRNDLRLHDQPLIHTAIAGIKNTSNNNNKIELLPLYCLDPRQYDLSPLNGKATELGPFEPAKTWHFAFPRAAEHKTRYASLAI